MGTTTSKLLHPLKSRRDKKKQTSQSSPQPFSPSESSAVRPDAQNLQSSEPPPATFPQASATITKELEREAAISAPLPMGNPNPTIPTSNTKATTKAKKKMASDEDYTAFLEKANRDPNEGIAKTQGSSGEGKMELKAMDKGAKLPGALKEATKDAFYMSDADEPFEPVCLDLDGGGGLPGEVEFLKLVNHPSPNDADVSIMEVKEWDPSGQYKELVEAIKKVVDGSEVKVYRIVKGGTRVEFWVVGVEGGKLVGAKALAVES